VNPAVRGIRYLTRNAARRDEGVSSTLEVAVAGAAMEPSASAVAPSRQG
jgi:hypothetical protein